MRKLRMAIFLNEDLKMRGFEDLNIPGFGDFLLKSSNIQILEYSKITRSDNFILPEIKFITNHQFKGTRGYFIEVGEWVIVCGTYS